MRERPIPFSGPMVRAILAGSKTQTRRVLKPQPEDFIGGPGTTLDGISPAPVIPVWWNERAERLTAITSPYGEPGDRLWVREAWRLPASADPLSGAEVGRRALEAGYSHPWAPTHYEADGHRTGEWRSWPDRRPGRYRQARFMPRWASRITLKVTEVRVERLQDISEADARAEGVSEAGEVIRALGEGNRCSVVDGLSHTARGAFAALWDEINGKRPGCAWESNPWVWAVSFQRLPDA